MGLPFAPAWLFNSEIVRAVSSTPLGPYKFADVVLPERAAGNWDGRMTHNPSIHRWRDKWILFYTGTTYNSPRPGAGEKLTWDDPRLHEAHSNQMIGIAVADKIEGPWERKDKPVLEPRAGKWDSLITTNAAPWIDESGEVTLVYKSVAKLGDDTHLGIARASDYKSSFSRLKDDPINISHKSRQHIEDPFLWMQDGNYYLLVKDILGNICDEAGGGIVAYSTNGIDWQPCDPPNAFSRTIKWDSGKNITHGYFERAKILFEENGKKYLFAATTEGGSADFYYHDVKRSWTMVIPILAE